MMNDCLDTPASIKHVVHDVGVYMSDHPVSQDEVMALANDLGSILHVTHVTISPNPNARAIFSAKEIPYHTDAADAHYLIWWAQCQGFENEFLKVIDVSDIPDCFSADELEQLQKVTAYSRREYAYPVFNSRNNYCLISHYHGKLKLNFTHWMDYDWPSTDLKDRFLDYIDHKEKYPKQYFLKQGHYLVLNNNFLMHARTLLSPNSPRNHIRIMIGLN